MIQVLNQSLPLQKDALQKEISHSILASAYAEKSDWEKAIPHLKAIQKNRLGEYKTEESTILMILGNCYLKTGNATEAGKAFSASLALEPALYESNLGRFEACLLALQDPEVQNNPAQKAAFENQARKDFLILKQAPRMIRRFPSHENKTLDVSTLKVP